MPDSTRVVLVHGFTQSAAAWPRTIVDGLSRLPADVVAVDVPGHGRRSHVRADVTQAAALLAEEGPADFVGYSMGGRLALHVASIHPEAVRKLVLIGASPGIESEAERQARRDADEELARFVEREGVERFLERWMANPLFSTLPPAAAALDARVVNTAEGLAASLRLMGTGSQESLWEALPALHHEVLMVAGELDEKFAAIARRMAEAWGGPARVELVARAGHAAHLERPDVVRELLVDFLHDTTSAVTSRRP